MGAAESAPRRISMQKNDMGGITVTSSVIKKFGDVPEGVGISNGTGLSVEFTSGRKYIDFNDVRAQLNIIESKLKQQSIEFTGVEFLSEDELNLRRHASEKEEENEKEDERRRAEAEARWVQQRKDLKKALRHVEQQRRQDESKFESVKQDLMQRQAERERTEESIRLEEREKMEVELMERAKRSEELKQGALVAAETVALEELQHCEAVIRDHEAEFSQHKREMEANLQALHEQLSKQTRKCADLESVAESCDEEFQQMCSELLASREELSQQRDSYEEKIKSLESTASAEQTEAQVSTPSSEQLAAAIELDAFRDLVTELEAQLKAEKDKYSLMVSTPSPEQLAVAAELDVFHDLVPELEAQLKAEKDKYTLMVSTQSSEQIAAASELDAFRNLIPELEAQLKAEKDKYSLMVNGREKVLRELRDKGVQNVNNMIRPLQTAPVCENVQAGVLACYRDNKSMPLKCSQEVQAFIDCVQTRRLELLQEKIVH